MKHEIDKLKQTISIMVYNITAAEKQIAKYDADAAEMQRARRKKETAKGIARRKTVRRQGKYSSTKLPTMIAANLNIKSEIRFYRIRRHKDTQSQHNTR